MGRYGIQARVGGTVLIAKTFNREATLVEFDPDENAGVMSGDTMEIPVIHGVKNGERVILEYVTSPSGAMWYGKKGNPDAKPKSN